MTSKKSEKKPANTAVIITGIFAIITTIISGCFLLTNTIVGIIAKDKYAYRFSCHVAFYTKHDIICL